MTRNGIFALDRTAVVTMALMVALCWYGLLSDDAYTYHGEAGAALVVLASCVGVVFGIKACIGVRLVLAIVRGLAEVLTAGCRRAGGRLALGADLGHSDGYVLAIAAASACALGLGWTVGAEQSDGWLAVPLFFGLLASFVAIERLRRPTPPAGWRAAGGYQFRTQDVRAVLEEALAIARHRLRKAGMTCELFVPVDVRVRADAMALAHSVAQLLENAATHAAEGRHVVVSALPEAGAVRIAVEDFGPGFAPDAVAARGEGLRLAEAHARAHGGRLERAHGTAGQGAVVAIRLPAERVG